MKITNEYGTFEFEVQDTVSFYPYVDHYYSVYSLYQFHNNPRIIVVLEPNNAQTSRHCDRLVDVKKYVPPEPKRKFEPKKMSRVEANRLAKLKLNEE